MQLPSTAEELRADPLVNEWWYYQVELLPGVVAKGAFPMTHPMLPRLLMRRCDLRGMACLDIGTMEGLTPVLMSRGGASRVLAIDGVDHCVEKIAAVKHYHRASFEYRTVGPMYSLCDKLEGEGFDLICCSGLLYHVFSPLMMLAGLRGALKKRGLLIVATAVIVDRGFSAEFNAAGRFQNEPNTFWYLSTGLLDYMLRYLRLAPIGVIHQPHDEMTVPWRLSGEGKPSGHTALLCQAVDREMPAPDDEWMAESAKSSWEYEWIPDWSRADAQPVSRIKAKPGVTRWREFVRRGPRPIDLTTAIEQGPPVTNATAPSDSYMLSLTDRD